MSIDTKLVFENQNKNKDVISNIGDLTIHQSDKLVVTKYETQGNLDISADFEIESSIYNNTLEILDISGSSSIVSNIESDFEISNTNIEITNPLYLNSKFDLIIKSKGVLEQSSFLNLGYGFKLVSKNPDGDDIYISIDLLNIESEPTNFTVINDITSGQNNFKGNEYDWGNLEIIDNNINPLSPIIQFDDTPIFHYLGFITNTNNEKEYIIHPTPNYDIFKYTKIRKITNANISVLISNGTIVENYDNIVTIYDFFDKIKNSNLVYSPSPIGKDYNITNGAAGLLFPLRTTGYKLPLKYIDTDGSDIIVELLSNPIRTENIKIECLNIDQIGSEIWKVFDSSGEIGEIVTNNFTNIAGRFRIKIKQKLPNTTINGVPNNRITGSFETQEIDDPATVVIRDLFIGAKAKTKEYIFTYKKRPPVACIPPLAKGEIKPECLGLPIPEEENLSAMHPLEKSTRDTIYEWFVNILENNIYVFIYPEKEYINVNKIHNYSYGTVFLHAENITLIQKFYDFFDKHLRIIFDNCTSDDLLTESTDKYLEAFSEMTLDAAILCSGIKREFWENYINEEFRYIQPTIENNLS